MAGYEVDLMIPTFKGLLQDGDGVNVDPKYALEAVNVDTMGGVLAPAARHSHLLPELEAPIGTLMRLHRRWMEKPDVLVAASAGRLYWMMPDSAEWTPVEMPEGIDAFQSDLWSWATYELSDRLQNVPIDALLLSNEYDGLMLVRGDTMQAQAVNAPRKFGIISRYAERIWGAAIPDDPDMLVYSTPFDPLNWEPNVQFPEDGAGDIMQPSWDGDSFQALVPFGSQLIAMKKNRVWRILGDNPSQYVFREQYGGGAWYPDTVASVGEDIYLLGPEGLLCYDGLSVNPFRQEYARDVFQRMNKDVLRGAVACLYKGRYYCALPLDGAKHNNAVLIYTLSEKTWLLREGVTVRDFLPMDDALYFTSIERPGRVYRWGEDAAVTGAEPCRWKTPFFDFGRKNVVYGGFTVYLTVEAEAPVTLSVTIRTEKKTKTKNYRVVPQLKGERHPKQRRMEFGGTGRRFQVEIASNDTVPWKLPGGLQVTVERDPD